jgi:hypothetical protein
MHGLESETAVSRSTPGSSLFSVSFKCICIVNTIHSLHPSSQWWRLSAFYVKKTFLSSLFLKMLLSEISSVEVNLECCFLGHNALSKTQHRRLWMIKKSGFCSSMAALHTLFSFHSPQMSQWTHIVHTQHMLSSIVTIWWTLCSDAFKLPDNSCNEDLLSSLAFVYPC